MIQEIKHDKRYKDLLFLGDIHGNFKILKYFIRHYKLNGVAIFQVGDFGVGYNPKQETHELNMLNMFLQENDCFLYAIRGNHDDPACFNNQWMFSNIFLVDDWTVMEMDVEDTVERIFCFGGAISIDRKRSQEEMKICGTPRWWPDELPKFNDDLNDLVKDITICVSHTSPIWAEPFGFNDLVYEFAKGDGGLLDDLIRERRMMTYLFDDVYENNKETLKSHYYGHFHFAKLQDFKGVKLRLLNINELCPNL